MRNKVSMKPIPNNTLVGHAAQKTTSAKVAGFGYVVTSRPVELNGRVVDWVYAVSEEMGGPRLYFHSELTTKAFETAAMQGH